MKPAQVAPKATSMRTLPQWLRGLGNRAGDLLFPPLCSFCGVDLEHATDPLGLCGACIAAMLPPPRIVCPRCGSVLGVVGQTCLACAERRMRVDAVVTLGDYHAVLREAVLRAKHARDSVLAHSLARLLWRQHGPELAAWRADVVVPVPMHWLRRAWRGVNNPEAMANILANQLSVPASNLLRRQRRTPALGPLSAPRRRLAMRGAFRLLHPSDFRGARVLLIDDVVTSGATTNAIAQQFRKARAEFVAVAAICRTQSPASQTTSA